VTVTYNDATWTLSHSFIVMCCLVTVESSSTVVSHSSRSGSTLDKHRLNVYSGLSGHHIDGHSEDKTSVSSSSWSVECRLSEQTSAASDLHSDDQGGGSMMSSSVECRYLSEETSRLSGEALLMPSDVRCDVDTCQGPVLSAAYQTEHQSTSEAAVSTLSATVDKTAVSQGTALSVFSAGMDTICTKFVSTLGAVIDTTDVSQGASVSTLGGAVDRTDVSQGTSVSTLSAAIDKIDMSQGTVVSTSAVDVDSGQLLLSDSEVSGTEELVSVTIDVMSDQSDIMPIADTQAMEESIDHADTIDSEHMSDVMAEQSAECQLNDDVTRDAVEISPSNDNRQSDSCSVLSNCSGHQSKPDQSMVSSSLKSISQNEDHSLVYIISSKSTLVGIL